MTIKELKEHIKDYDDDMPCAYALWLPSDVGEIAESEKVELSGKEVGEILDDVHSSQDAEFGISWGSLRCAVKDFVGDKTIKKILNILSEDWNKEGTKEFVLKDMLEEYFYNEFKQDKLDQMLKDVQEERGGD